MKNLYLISKKSYKTQTQDLLIDAARKKNIDVKIIDSEEFNYSNPVNLTNEDSLYKISTGDTAALIEKILINSEVSSFYSNVINCLGKLDNFVGSSLVHQKYNLPIIKTIFSITNNRELLEKYVDSLEGFPLIIKCLGGMHGVGVMKIDSFDSLLSVSDYLITQKNQFILRKFIKHKKQARIIVLGDKVIASHENLTNIDFRSNAGDNETRKRHIITYNTDIQEIAVKAVNSLGYEFGGVDILFEEETNEPYIAEVNFPCFFPTTQRLTGIDIAGKMIDHLIEKSSKK